MIKDFISYVVYSHIYLHKGNHHQSIFLKNHQEVTQFFENKIFYHKFFFWKIKSHER